MSERITCNILTPEKSVYSGEVDSVIIPAFDGEMGFLKDHTPLVSELDIGIVKLKDKNNVEQIAVYGGFAEIRDNNLVVLTNDAYTKETVNLDEVNTRLAELEKQKSGEELEDSDSRAKLELEIRKLEVCKRIAS